MNKSYIYQSLVSITTVNRGTLPSFNVVSIPKARLGGMTCSSPLSSTPERDMSRTPLQLLCWIPELKSFLLVFIEPTASVHELKKDIKKEKEHGLAPYDADTLSLLKVSIPYDDNFEQTISNMDLTGQKPLFAVDELSEVFSDPPLPKYLHIVVHLPSAGESPYTHCSLLFATLICINNPC